MARLPRNPQHPHLLKASYRRRDCRLAADAGTPHQSPVGDFCNSRVTVDKRHQYRQDAPLRLSQFSPYPTANKQGNDTLVYARVEMPEPCFAFLNVRSWRERRDWESLCNPRNRTSQITVKRITEYRAWWASQTKEVKAGETVRHVLCAGPATLNAELGILRRILKRARLWARVADDRRPLKEPSTSGKALTEDDKQRLLQTAVMRPEWETAYLAAISA